jgi:hypothetical protein
VLLITATFLIAIGFTTWTIGEVFSYSGIGVIGGTLVLLTGSAIVLTDLQYRAGVDREFAYQTINNSTVVSNTSTDPQYERTDVGAALGATVIASLGIGGLLMLLGGVLISRSVFDEELL